MRVTGTHSHCPVFHLQRREFEDGKNQNRLRETDIQKIVSTFKTFKTIHKYAYRATFKEEEIDIRAVQKEIDELERKLAETRTRMDGYFSELGLAKTNEG